jgi:hypothetical protein
MLVIGSNGFIDWARSSYRLMKSGVFYRARQQTIPLPEQSLAARQGSVVGAFAEADHPRGVWLGDEDVREMTIFSHSNEMTISLLLYSNDAHDKRWANELDEPEEWDTYDQFVAGNHGSLR